MDTLHQLIASAIDAGARLGSWPSNVTAFLKRTAAMDFLEEFIAETEVPASEGIGNLLAAIRFIDHRSGADHDVPTVLEAPPGSVDLDLFMLRHASELYQLCRSRPLQTNLPERALPVAELLAKRFPGRSVAVIEIGASNGLIGRTLRLGASLEAHWDHYFEAGQQRPLAWPAVALYRGIDRTPPDEAWALACVPFDSVRRRTERFLHELPHPSECQVSRGSALDLPEHPAVRELLPRFDQRKPGALVPVVLSSFLLSRLKPEKRRQLGRLIRQFAAAHGGAWVNLDRETDSPDSQADRFLASMDGEPRLILDSEFCRSWKQL